ncbi:MAG: fructokinase [Rhodospirillaceae bacterium]|nr:fructokinase [Rhodospirillaceae bacterium]
MTDAVCLGELLIDFVPTVTGTSLVDAPAFKKAPGGAPANVAVGLARLGASAAFMGKVGDDPFGHFLADTLAAAGVDVAPLVFTGKARTALAFVSLRADGEREFMFYRHPSADMLFAPEDVDVDLIARARLLHFGSISLIDEPCRGATLHAVREARAAGLLISYDPNLRLALWRDSDAARAGMMLGWPNADVIKVSEDELDFLTGEADPVRAARSLWHDRLRLLVVTRGRDGCLYLTRQFAGDLPGFAVEAVDATGAGDAFVAGLLAGLLADPTVSEDEARLRELCRFANAAGALATTGRGAIPALPDRARVLDFLDQQAPHRSAPAAL